MYNYSDAFQTSLKYFNNNELAARVFLDKYALKDNDGNLLEDSPEKMHRRIAKEFARIEKNKFKKPLSEDEIFSYLDQFKYIIPQGSPMYGIGNPYQNISISNCFVIDPPSDSFGGICKADEELVQISKRRGGVGLDISQLRPNGSITTNSSKTSSGIISFMGRYSNSIREVGQNGRRGALMITLDVKHPESVILWDKEKNGDPFEVNVANDSFSFKTTSEYYNPDLLDFVTAKYDIRKVTGANISLRISDEFMNAVVNGKKFKKQWPINSKNPSIVEEIDARRAWDKIIKSAWQTAEPGVLFWDNIIKNSPADCYPNDGFATMGTNPCSELPLSPYDSCRLIAENLFSFVQNPYAENASFDFEKLKEVTAVAQRLMDDLVDLEAECVQRIIDKIKKDPEPDEIKQRELVLWQKIYNTTMNGRRTGLGITALGDTIAALGIQYGSQESIDFVDKIYKTIKLSAYRSSVEMAREIGAFPVWDASKETKCPYLLNIKTEDPKLYSDMNKYGRRNIALLTTAPTGTLSILTKLVNHFGSSSGIEPQYDIEPYVRRRKISEGDVGTKVDFVDQNGDKWENYDVYPSGIQEWMEISGKKDLKKSPYNNAIAKTLDWKNRVILQSTAQKHVDHALSSTINLPHDVTVDKVKEIYETAWKYGCKGITVYRDGCRTGVLVSKSDSSVNKKVFERPKDVECEIHHTKIRSYIDGVYSPQEFFVIIGVIDGQPRELFSGSNGHFAAETTHGVVTKSRSHYKLTTDEGKVFDLNDLVRDEMESVCRFISLMLQRDVEIVDIVRQLEKVNSGDLCSFTKSIARVLKKYIPDGTKEKEKCQNCEGQLIRQDGCVICSSCGWSKC